MKYMKKFPKLTTKGAERFFGLNLVDGTCEFCGAKFEFWGAGLKHYNAEHEAEVKQRTCLYEIAP